MTHSFSPISPKLEYAQWRPIISVQSLGVVSRGKGSRFWYNLKQIKAPFLFIGASYSEHTVGAGSRAVIAGGAAHCLSGWHAGSAWETPSPDLAPECVLAQQVSHENSRLTPGHPPAGATPTFFLPGAVACFLRLPHAERVSSSQPQGHPLTNDSQWQAN